MISWRNTLLFFAVALFHAAAIYAIWPSLHGTGLQSALPGKLIQAQLLSFETIASLQVPRQIANASIPTIFQAEAYQRPANDAEAAPQPMKKTNDSIHNESHNRLKPEIFFKGDEVDETATPLENFEEILRSGLPLYFHGLVIEFWINSNGNTVQVRCADGDCSDADIAAFEPLLASIFQPAFKDGIAVPSRKLIAIDASPMY